MANHKYHFAYQTMNSVTRKKEGTAANVNQSNPKGSKMKKKGIIGNILGIK